MSDRPWLHPVAWAALAVAAGVADDAAAHVRAHRALLDGVRWAEAGEWTRAADAYTEAIRLRPDLAAAFGARAAAREAAGDDGGALADYAEALRLDPGDVPARYHREALLARRGRRPGPPATD